MQNHFGLLVMDVMPIYMIIAMKNIITMRFSINCPTVICVPTVCYVSREMTLVKTMASGSTFIILEEPKLPCCIYFTFYLLFNLYIYHYQIWSLQVMSSRGLTTLLHCPRWVQVFALVCVGTVWLGFAWFSYWFDNLGSHWGKYYPLLYCFTLSLREKSQRSSQVASTPCLLLCVAVPLHI